MSEKGKLDPIDKKIIELLKEDGRMSFRKIAEIIGKTEATVRRRVKTMLKEEYIKKFTIVIDKKAMGMQTKATIKIKPEIRHIREITESLSKLEEVTDVWRLSGECGVLVRVEIPTIRDLDILIEEKISKIEGVNISETCFITREIKTSN